MFLVRKQLEGDLELEEMVRALQTRRLPVVLTHDEVPAVVSRGWMTARRWWQGCCMEACWSAGGPALAGEGSRLLSTAQHRGNKDATTSAPSVGAALGTFSNLKTRWFLDP